MKQIAFDALLWHGRYFDHQGVRYTNNTCGGFSVIFTGKKLAVSVLSNGKEKFGEDMYAYLLLKRGEEETVFCLNEAEQLLTLVDEAEAVTVSLSLIKRTEQQYGSFGVKEILADDEAVVAKPAEKAHKILFIGDSLTCGYGNAGGPEDPFVTAQEYGELGYAALTAKNLSAEPMFVSRSGIGLHSTYTDLPNHRETSILIRSLLPYADAIGCEALGIEKLPWSAENFQPNAVVINLGTNDSCYTGYGEQNRLDYVADYDAFLSELRADYPDAELVVALGPVNPETTRLFAKLLYLVEKKRAAGDAKVSACLFAMAPAEEGMGAAGHPSLATDISMAAHLTRHLKLRLFGEVE